MPLVYGLVTALHLLESRMCQPSAVHTERMSQMIMQEFGFSLQHDPKVYHLLQRKLEETFAEHKRKFSATFQTLPSPYLTTIWPFLPHEPGNFGTALTDAAHSDGTSIFHILQYMDAQDSIDRPKSVMIFDTTPHGQLPGHMPQLTIDQIFPDTIRQLKRLNFECSDQLVPNPNYLFDYKSQNETIVKIWEELYMGYHFDINWSHFKSEFDVRVPGGPIFGEEGPTRSNKYWGMKGGWYFTMSNMDLNLAFFDEWLLEKIPDDYAKALLKKAWPTLGIQRRGGGLAAVNAQI